MFIKLIEYVKDKKYDDSISDPYLEFMKQYTLLDAVRDLGIAWDMVPTSTIKASFNNLLDIGKLNECLAQERDFAGFEEDHTGNSAISTVEQKSTHGDILSDLRDRLTTAHEEGESFDEFTRKEIVDLVKLFNDTTLLNSTDESVRARTCWVKDDYVREDLDIDMLNCSHELYNNT